MPDTLLILTVLGVVAWLLAGGWPLVRDRPAAADDGATGLGLGVTAACPACVSVHLEPVPVGAPRRQRSPQLRCGVCDLTYTVRTTVAFVPSPRGTVD